MPGEHLVRIIVSPQHVNKNGQPRAAALSEAETHGLSLLRSDYVVDDEIRAVAEGLVSRARSANNSKAGVVGVLEMAWPVMKEARDELDCTSYYCVYDTALPDCRSHAEAFQRMSGVPDALCDERRRVLFTAVKGTFKSVADYRGGLLRYLAPAG